MMNASQQAKQRGARCYAAKDYAGAVTCFSEAIERADGNDMDLHLYHSNRCATRSSAAGARRWRMRKRRCKSSRRGRRAGRAWVLASSATRGVRGEAAKRCPCARGRTGPDRTTAAATERWFDADAVADLVRGARRLDKAGVWAAALFALYRR